MPEKGGEREVEEEEGERTQRNEGGQERKCEKQGTDQLTGGGYRLGEKKSSGIGGVKNSEQVSRKARKKEGGMRKVEKKTKGER